MGIGLFPPFWPSMAPDDGADHRYDGAVTEHAGSGLMAGPTDRAPEQLGPDSVRTRESDPVGAELRQRMERLPPGHPSSPYNGDGSRKPPVPDPFEHDYPIPGDPDYQRDAPSALDTDQTRHVGNDDLHARQSPTADHDPDQELPADSREVRQLDSREEQERRLSQITDLVAAKCREAEGRDADGNYGERGLTPAMRRIEAQTEHGKLAPETEKYALKGRDRFMEKLAEMVSDEPDKPADELAREIHDGIRYTFLIASEHYAVGVRDLTSKLEVHNFELGAIKNKWDNDEYKGINTRWLDHESGVRFEVQFHTEQSWLVKQETHNAYVKIHDTRTPTVEREWLRDHQREISAQVLRPPGCEDIFDFRKEGW